MRLLVLVILLVPALAATCGPQGPVSWKTYADLSASRETLPVQLVVGPGLGLAEAQAQANAIGCGVDIVLSGTVTGNLLLTPRCPFPTQLGIRVRGPATLIGGIRVSCVGADCAWASFEQLSVVATLDDAFDVGDDGRMAVIGSTGVVSGAYSNVLTAHAQSWLLALNTSGASTGPDRAPPVAIVQNAKATIIGRGTFDTASAPNDSVVALGGSNGGSVRATLIGHRLACSAAQQSSIAFDPGAGGTVNLETGVLDHGCPAHAVLDRVRERVVWRILRDRLLGLTVASPMIDRSDMQVEIDGTNGVLVGLAVPIPAWVDGFGALAVQVVD